MLHHVHQGHTRHGICNIATMLEKVHMLCYIILYMMTLQHENINLQICTAAMQRIPDKSSNTCAEYDWQHFANARTDELPALCLLCHLQGLQCTLLFPD